MKVLTKYGVVEVSTGDQFKSDTEWIVTEISERKIGAMYSEDAPVCLAETNTNTVDHEFQAVAASADLALAVLEELNVKSFVCGKHGAFHGELVATLVHEYRNGIENNHSPEFKGDDVLQLDINVDDDLFLEGLAREIARSITGLRKKMKCNVEDKVNVMWESDDELVRQTWDRFGEYICCQCSISEFNVVDYLVDPVVVKLGKVEMKLQLV